MVIQLTNPLCPPLATVGSLVFALLRVPRLRRFYLAHFQSQLGTGAAYVALVLVAYQRLHSALAISLGLLADFLPSILLSPVCGALADRYSRRTLAVTAELLRATAFLGLAVTSSFAGTVGLALVAGAGTALYGPAMNAALPTLTTVEQRSASVSLYGAMVDFGITVGPGIAALVLLFSGPPLVLALNGATFLISAALLYGVPLGRGERDPDADGSLWGETRAGAHAAAAIPGLLTLLALSSATVLAAGGMNVVEPLLATHVLHAAASGYAILVACYGTGMIAGSLISARAGSRVAVLRRWWLAGLALNGTSMLATSIVPSLPFALVTFVLTGISNSLVIRPEIRLLQELAPDELRGRVFGLRDVCQNAAFLVAVLGAGLMLGTLGPRAVFAIDGAIVLALAPTGSLLFRPRPALAPPLAA